MSLEGRERLFAGSGSCRLRPSSAERPVNDLLPPDTGGLINVRIGRVVRI